MHFAQAKHCVSQSTSVFTTLRNRPSSTQLYGTVICVHCLRKIGKQRTLATRSITTEHSEAKHWLIRSLRQKLPLRNSLSSQAISRASSRASDVALWRTSAAYFPSLANELRCRVRWCRCSVAVAQHVDAFFRLCHKLLRELKNQLNDHFTKLEFPQILEARVQLLFLPFVFSCNDVQRDHRRYGYHTHTHKT